MSDKMLESALRRLDRALDAMNRAIEMTATEGPGVAIEYIADFLNDSDGLDEDVADAAPDDWLTRWHVIRAYRCSQEPHPGVEFYGPNGGCAECGYPLPFSRCYPSEVTR